MTKNKNHSELSKEDYEHYLKSDKSGKKAHAFEKAVSESNFDSDALDGLDSISADTAITDLKVLERRIAGKRKTFGYWKMAAAISLLLISSAVIWQIVDQIKEPKQLSMSEDIEQEEKQKDSSSLAQNKEESITPKPDLQSTTNIEVEKKEVESVNSKEISNSIPTPSTSTEPDTEEIIPTIPKNETIEEVTNEPSEAVHDEVALDLDFEVANEDVLEETALEELGLEVQEERSLFFEEKATTNTPIPSTRKVAKRAARARSEAIPSAAPTASRRITGIVSDKELNEPIPGVSVIEKGTTNGAVTDFNGTYSLALENPSSSELAFEGIGYVTSETKIDNEDQVNVALDVDITSLPEVVVSGYATDSSEPTGYISPKPIGGQKSFDEYIAQNKIYPHTAQSEGTSGRVVLKVSIDMYGALSEVDITKPLGAGCDEEAVRLIKNWTGWEPAQLDGKPIASNIKVRIRFP